MTLWFSMDYKLWEYCRKNVGEKGYKIVGLVFHRPCYKVKATELPACSCRMEMEHILCFIQQDMQCPFGMFPPHEDERNLHIHDVSQNLKFIKIHNVICVIRNVPNTAGF